LFRDVTRDFARLGCVDREERPLLAESNPELYRLTAHFGRSPGYLLVWLEHAAEQTVRERLLDA
jgi:hypothetical protein